MVKGKREGYCANPQFALSVTVEEIKAIANAFNDASRAPLFTEALASNNYEPCQFGLTVNSAKEICASTMGQSKDTRWHAERSRRVTSSVFGKIINRRKSVHPSSLIKSILNKQKKASVSASVQWGVDNETNAILKYQNELQNNVPVANCGLVVSPKWPWLM